MAYLRLYRLGENTPDTKPDAVCAGVRVFDNEGKIHAEYVLAQHAYLGWCRAEIVHGKGDVEPFEYVVNLTAHHGLTEDVIFEMASRSKRKRKRMSDKDLDLDSRPEFQPMKSIEDDVGLPEMLDTEGVSDELVIDYAKKAEPIIIELRSELMGVLSEFLGQTRKMERNVARIKASKGLTPEQKEAQIGQQNMNYMDFVSSFLSEMVLDLSDETVTEELVRRHLRFMDMKTMQGLIMSIIKGEVVGPKLVEELSDQHQALTSLTGQEQSQASQNTTESALERSPKN